jgi:ParB-like chromosome segregation protein Spo0J
MHIEHLALDALIPYARNSRTHSDEQVAQIAGSIREFGFTNPVLIDGDGGIIAGHGRVMAARKLGLDEVPCIRLAHLTDAQKRAYIIADNKLALNAGWDDQMLAIEIRAICEIGFDVELTGYGENEIDGIYESFDMDIAAALADDLIQKSNRVEQRQRDGERKCPHCGGEI